MSHPEDRISVTLLDRYVAGVADADERARVEEWMARDPVRRLNALLRGEPSAQVRKALERLFASFGAGTTATRQDPQLSGGRRSAAFASAGHRALRMPRSRPWRWAVLTAVAGIAMVVVQRVAPGTVWSHARPRRASAAFATSAGQRAVVTLADGSRVTLGPQSTLRLEPGFDESARRVTLTGEAYFDVAWGADAPFIVRAGGVDARVLGTVFTVRRYPEEHRTRVVVIDGRVAVRSRAGGETILAARMLAEVPDSGPATFLPDSDVQRFTDWTRGQLVFRATPLREAFPELERRYGIVIRVADPTLADQRLTATVTDDPVTTVLDGIAMMFSVRYTRDGNVVTFLPSHPDARPRRDQPFSSRSEVSHGK